MKALWFVPVVLAMNGCGGDLNFDSRYAAIYRFSYERDIPTARGDTVFGYAVVDVQEDGDVEFVIDDGDYGLITGAGELGEDGTFTGTATLPDLPRGGGTITVSGEVEGSGADASVSGTISGQFSANFAGGYYEDRDINVFAGEYTGSMAAPVDAKLMLTIHEDGSIDVLANNKGGDYIGTGTITPLGEVVFDAAGNGQQMDFTGRFLFKGDGDFAYGAGQYEAFSLRSNVGNWSVGPDE